jgi:hypothetical protein
MAAHVNMRLQRNYLYHFVFRNRPLSPSGKNQRPAVEAAAQGAPVYRVFTAADARAEHVRHLAQ